MNDLQQQIIRIKTLPDLYWQGPHLIIKMQTPMY